MSLSMTREEREAFLADLHVGILSIAESGRGPLTVPIWYAYEPGGPVRMATGASSRKAKLLRAAGRASLCVQVESAPYVYVSVEGPITIAEPEYERDLRQVAYRYLGRDMGDVYLQSTASQHEPGANILVSLQPERWLSVDYRKMAG